MKNENDTRFIRRHEGANGNVIWRVDVRHGPFRVQRAFSSTKYGGEPAAFQTAKEWRDSTLAQLKALHSQMPPDQSGATAQQLVPDAMAQQPRRSLQAMHESSKAVGVTCLDSHWFGAHHLYSFRCSFGHEWKRKRQYQRYNPRCPTCSTTAGWAKSQLPDGLQRLQDVAQAKGGRCLSEQYLGHKKRHRFECAKGHVWETTANGIFSGYWCRLCAFDGVRLTLQDAQQAAQARGGRCLSTKYVNDISPLLWECDRGHTWQAPLHNLRRAGRGTWCPECAHLARITSRKSKARRRYVEAGQHLMGDLPKKGESM